MGEYLLGLDAGNTVIKAVIFDLKGNEIASVAQEGHSRMPQPGHVERGLTELWANARAVIKQAITNAGISPTQIAAIGCAGHGNGLYALDREGEPLLAIQSLDTRAADLVEEWQSANVGDRTYPISLQRPWPSQTPTLLAWIKHKRPELFAKIGTVFFCKDFIVNRLTGQRVSEMSDMAGSGLLNVTKRQYDHELMCAYGLDDCLDLLPPLIESADIAGTISENAAEQTGLAVGTPVIGGLFDVVASAIGSGVTRTNAASIIVGTWSINQVITDKPILKSPVFMSSTFDRERFMAIESSATSAANLEWLVREFFHEEHADQRSPFDVCCKLAEATEPAANDPIYHPYLYGSQQNGNARAGFYGVAGWHTKGHLIRALLEGVAFGHRQHIETLRIAGVDFNEAVISGGGSRSLVWPQIFADVLGVPITVAHSHQTGALGVAIAAGTAVGIFADFEAGTNAMVRSERNYQPDASRRAHYSRRYRLYRDIADAMAPIWKRMAAVEPVTTEEAA